MGGRILLTGATSGIGRAAAYRLLPSADVLLLHGPEPEAEVQPLLADLRRRDRRPRLEYVPADYGRLAEVGAMAGAVRERVDALDLLVNNAGRPGPRARTVTSDGHEITIQVNFLAPVALTTGLLPLLQAAGGARIVNVSSATHHSARLSGAGLEPDGPYAPVTAYAHSKLAIVAYTCWLADRLGPGGVEVVSVHPGVIATGLLHAMFDVGGGEADLGARNVATVAAMPPGIGGRYFDEDVPAAPNPQARDPGLQRGLMAATAAALRAAGVPAPDA